MGLQIRQHDWRRKYTGQRFMTVKQILWILFHHDVDCIEQAIQASLFDKRCAEIRHNKITDEHHPIIGKMDEKRIASFSPVDRDEFDPRSSNLNLCLAVYSRIGFETSNVFQIEAAPEEDLTETTGSIKHRCEFFAVVFTRVKFQARIEAAEVRVASDVVPVRMGYHNGC